MKDFIRYSIAIACVLYLTIPEAQEATLEPSEPVVEVEATPLPALPIEPVPEPKKEIVQETTQPEVEPVVASVPVKTRATYQPPLRYYYQPQTCSGPNCQAPQRRQGILRRWRRS
jgi:hypothetical protein